jgi:hypothetical protein
MVPTMVEAVQFTGEMDAEIERWLGDAFNSWLPSRRALEVRTHEGFIVAFAGDYLIRGLTGDSTPTLLTRRS